MNRLRSAGVALLLALLAGVPQARAQDEAGPNARAEMSTLAVGLRHEALTRVVASIEARVKKTNAEKAALIKARTITTDFAAAHLETGVEEVLKELFKEELRTNRLAVEDLKVDLSLFRAWESGWRLRNIPADAVPALRTGFSPPRRTGYLPEVAAIDPRAPHSMHDLGDYLADRFTHTVLDRIVAEGRTVEIHLGSEAEALQDLRNRGMKLIGEVRTPQGSYERIFLAESPQGEVRYVLSGTIDGLDRLRHLTSLLRFAGKDRRGVPSDKVVMVGDVEALKARTRRTLVEGLERIGGGGTIALVGFKATLHNQLLKRALARRGAEHLRDVLGQDPYEGLKAALAAEAAAATGPQKAAATAALEAITRDAKLAAGLRTNPASAITSVEGVDAIRGAESKLAALAKKHPQVELFDKLLADGLLRLPGGASAKEATISRSIESGPLKASELKVTTADGRTIPLKLVSNYYGDAMGDVTRALIESGHRTIAYFGTAGGTANGVRIGDVHVPSSVHDFRFEDATSGVRNAFLDYFAGKTSPLGDRLRLDTKLGNVFSPAEETMGWLEETRGRGIGAVEVENSYITREVGRHNATAGADKVSLYTSVIISDVPGSEHTLGNHNGATSHTMEKMLDHYLDALGVKDVAVTAKEAAKYPTRPLAKDEVKAKALEVADKLVPRNLPKSSFLRDRIAGIVERLPPETLAAIDTSKKLKPADIPGLSAEDRAALEAEVKGATTDAEAFASLERGNAAVSRLAAELRSRFPNAEYELKVGGGLETGSYSPARGLEVEVKGDPAVRAAAAELLPGILAEAGQPKVRLVEGLASAVSFGKGEAFLTDPDPLSRENLSRALTERGVNVRGATTEYAGREHDPTTKPSTLYSRFELANTGPVATPENLRSFVEKLGRYDARVEWVKASDPRLAGGQARTIIDSSGRTVILLPKDAPVRRYALIDELTHAIQLDRMRRTLGAAELKRVFAAAEAGDPSALARMLQWEIEAKRMVRLTLPEGHPDRALMDREIARLRAALDPYLAVRAPSGRVDWAKVRAKAREHGEGAASFLLGLFLMELAKAAASGDRSEIEAFFDGLATTEFWKHYGLFVVGAEAGTMAYSKFLQRFVKPSFVSTVLKSNVALATGMALPMIATGHFSGKTFAIDLGGLMLSSAAVKAGLAGLRWVVPLGEMSSRYAGLARALRVARGVPGWIYAAVETAVVLYVAQEISGRANAWLDERRARRDVTNSAEALLAAARGATSADDAALLEAMEGTLVTYSAWRDRSLAPAMDATVKLNAALERAGREATISGTGASRFEAIASRYPGLTAAVDRFRGRSDAEVDARVAEAVKEFEADRDAALRRAYADGRRAAAYDPVEGAWHVSDNRSQAFDDEVALYEAAARAARSPAVAAALRERARLLREVKTQDYTLLHPDAPKPAQPPARGLTDAVREGTPR